MRYPKLQIDFSSLHLPLKTILHLLISMVSMLGDAADFLWYFLCCSACEILFKGSSLCFSHYPYQFLARLFLLFRIVIFLVDVRTYLVHLRILGGSFLDVMDIMSELIYFPACVCSFTALSLTVTIYITI